MIRRTILSFAVAAQIAVCAAPAFGHTIAPGANGFTDGLLHPFGSPGQIMAALAIALLLGRHAADILRMPLYIFFSSLIAGLVIGPLVARQFNDAPDMTIPMLAIAGTSGLLVVWARDIPKAGLAVIAAAAGFCLGLDSLPENASLQQLLAALAGSGIALVIFALNGVALAQYARDGATRRPWLVIGQRVIGSWIAAAALLVLALQLRGVF